MVRFTALLEEAASQAHLRPLAVVPFLASFSYVDKLRRLRTSDGVHFGVSFGFPEPIATVWTFVHVPQRDGGGVYLHTPELLWFPIATVLLGGMAAGYLGSIDAGLDGAYDVRRAVRSYALPLIGFEFLKLGVIGAVAAAALVAVPVAVGLLLVGLVLGYLFYAAPYLIVAADCSLVAALRRSFTLATDGGAYATFFVSYLLAVAAVSLVATPLVVNLGLLGAVLGAALAAVPALTLNVATMLFVRSLVDTGQGTPDGTGPAGPSATTMDG